MHPQHGPHMQSSLSWHMQVLDEKETAVYKRALEEQYKLKMKASRCALGCFGVAKLLQ